MLKRMMSSLYASAMDLNDRNVCKAMDAFGPFGSILDVGCWDGAKTVRYAERAGAKEVAGIEVVQHMAVQARGRGIATYNLVADRDAWPFRDGSFDCVVSNQVIEHLADVDHFLSEAARILKRGGYLVTSTNNLASWHNVVSMVLGWAPFDLTNSSRRAIGIGNPLALHRGEMAEHGDSWCHKCIYTTRWLNDWCSLYGLQPVIDYGAGYYPLPSSVGAMLKRNSAFITLVSRKT